jgi:beta-barrel assembly-enhancing protease
VRARYGVVQDEAVHKYVALVGTVVTQASRRPNLTYEFIVLDTDGVNAFAAPGGFIHITRGALGLIQDEAELAGVLAHEIAHVTEKHTIKAIQKAKGFEIAADTGLQGNAALMRQLTDKTFEMVLAGFGRAEEMEADQHGIAVANEVGYAPAGLKDFLTRLTDRNKTATEKRGLFASHPDMTARMTAMDTQIAKVKSAGTVVLEDRYRKHITYKATEQSQIATVVAGAAGLASGSAPAKGGAEKSDAPAKGDAAKGDAKSGGSATSTAPSSTEKPAEEPKKKRGFGLGNLLRPGGEEKKSAQVTGSAGARGVDPERDAKGGSNPAVVAVKITPADIAAFKKQGGLKA